MLFIPNCYNVYEYNSKYLSSKIVVFLGSQEQYFISIISIIYVNIILVFPIPFLYKD